MDKINRKLLSVVVPVYNEQEVLNETCRRLTEVLQDIEVNHQLDYEIILVNDGSRDATAQIALNICENDTHYKFLNFSRNFGHQIAITAGMDYSSGDAVVVIDADLQDPPEIIKGMVIKWKEGFEVVYGKRLSRKGETFFKKFTSKVFYRMLSAMTEVDIPKDVGDFRLIDKKVKESLALVNERNRYIRGIISWLGFKQTEVSFVREERFAGETKYPLKKMIKFAFDAITSFSNKPLRIATYAGTFISVCSFIYLIIVMILFFCGKTVTGWASMVAIMLFFNGIILLILGIIGEYIGRIYDEAKGRPLYLIANAKNFDQDILTKR